MGKSTSEEKGKISFKGRRTKKSYVLREAILIALKATL